MTVFPQPNAPGMAHVPPRTEGNNASSTRCKNLKAEKIKKEKASENICYSRL
jgi:hypothetical protein